MADRETGNKTPIHPPTGRSRFSDGATGQRMKLTALTSKRALFTNAAGNTLGLVAQLVVSFVMAPIVLRALGDARNGIWTFVESFLAYLMLFDLGIAASLVRFVPRHVASDDGEGLNRIFSACLV